MNNKIFLTGLSCLALALYFSPGDAFAKEKKAGQTKTHTSKKHGVKHNEDKGGHKHSHHHHHDCASKKANIELVKKAMEYLVITETVNKQTFYKYFAKNFVFNINNKEMKDEEFMKSLSEIKSGVKSMNLSWKTIISSGDKVFSKHTSTMVKKDGTKTKVKVLAEYTIKNGKIICVDQVMHDMK